jgi:hypothetical protein
MLILLRCDDPFLVKLLVLLAGRRWLHPGTITISRLSRFAHLKNNSQRNQPADHCASAAPARVCRRSRNYPAVAGGRGPQATGQPAAAVTDASDRGSKARSGRHRPYRSLEKSVIALPLTQSGLSHNASITVRACISASYSVPRRNIYLLISIAYHRRYGRAVWIDPVVLRAITISWNNIIIPVRSCPYHGHPDDKPRPRFITNDFGLLRMRCGTKRRQVTQDQGRSESYSHYPHASTSLPQRQINEHLPSSVVISSISPVAILPIMTEFKLRHHQIFGGREV